MISSLPPGYSPAYTNLKEGEEAQVLLFLVNHGEKNLDLEIYQTIKSLIPTFLFLTEQPLKIETIPGIEARCWENQEISARVFKKNELFILIKEVLEHLDDGQFLESKKNWALKILTRNYQAIHPEWQPLGKGKKELLNCLNELYKLFVDQTVRQTFPERQSTLIHEIAQQLNHKKIVVICGNNHGDVHAEFAKEAQRLVDFLEYTTKFAIFRKEHPDGKASFKGQL